MAIVKKYQTRVKEIKNLLPDIYEVTLESDKVFKFNPGQFLHLALDPYDPSCPWPDSRCFSVQSTPGLNDVTITYSVKGVFTKRMAEELNVGKEICVKLPYGEIFDKDFSKEKCVFIAGGTGLTPFLSLFLSDKFKDFVSSKLYFGVRAESYNVFNKYLENAKNNNSNFIVEVVNQEKSGVLNISKIFETHGKDSLYFVSGPPIMIKNFKKYLIENGLNAGNVITDDWE